MLNQHRLPTLYWTEPFLLNMGQDQDPGVASKYCEGLWKARLLVPRGRVGGRVFQATGFVHDDEGETLQGALGYLCPATLATNQEGGSRLL